MMPMMPMMPMMMMMMMMMMMQRLSLSAVGGWLLVHCGQWIDLCRECPIHACTLHGLIVFSRSTQML